MITAGALLVGTFLAGLLACRLALRLVRRLDLIDHPNPRSSHDRPTPRGGGIGILFALFVGAAGACAAGSCPSGLIVLALAFASLVLAVVGLLDDRKGMGAAAKGLPQVAVAILAVAVVGPVLDVSLPGTVLGLGLFAWLLTVFWLAGFSNAYNFIDGTDGIAALQAGLAAALMGGADLLWGTGAITWLAFPLAGACLAFLSVNWSPAKVFMGDVGSLPVGFLLASLAVLGNRAGSVPFVTSFLILGPFLFDTIFTLLRRAIRGENVLAAHRSHLYQRLVILGVSHARVAVLYGGWTLLTGALGILYLSAGTYLRIGTLGAGLLTGAVVAVSVQHAEKSRGDDERTH